MGSFSWLYANKMFESHKEHSVINIRYGSPFKLLIPKEFGGGYVIDHHYDDYGDLTYVDNKGVKHHCDLYEILAAWNADMIKNMTVQYSFIDFSQEPGFLGEITALPEHSEYTDHNRQLGIDIGCYDEQVNRLKYPLKLVNVRYKGTYEDCDAPSYSDPNQGWSPIYYYQIERQLTSYEQYLELRAKEVK